MRALCLWMLAVASCAGAASTPTAPEGDTKPEPDAGPSDDAKTSIALRGCPDLSSDPTVKQSLPQATVALDFPVMKGKTITVKAGAALQAAIDAAEPGDTLQLEAGATFEGPITLPKKNGDDWIVIRTSTPDADFVAPGTRVDPSLALKMATLVAPTNAAVIRTAPGAHHFRIVGLEVVPKPGVYVTTLVTLGGGGEGAENAHDIILDRMWVHPDPVGGRRGIALNSKSTGIVDSYLSGFREKGTDSQAICGWSGPGPYAIIDNHLEAASENIMFGGADPSADGLVPSDIQVCGNHLKKDLSWKGGGFAVKNLFELKNARRIVVAGNVMEYNWVDGQSGFAVVFTPRNQDGGASWSTVEDVTFAYNVVRHTASGINALARDDNHPSAPLSRVVLHDNLFDDIDPTQFGGDGRALQFVGGGSGGGAKFKLDHNTFTSNGMDAIVLGNSPGYGDDFAFTNNVVPRGRYGVIGSGKSEGAKSLDYYLGSYTFANNVMFGGKTDATAYPADNLFPPKIDDVGFNGDWSLGPASKYKSAGSDGRDPGADIATVGKVTSGVVR